MAETTKRFRCAECFSRQLSSTSEPMLFSLGELESHLMDIHMDFTPFSCPICSLVAVSANDIKSHRLLDHPTSLKSPLVYSYSDEALFHFERALLRSLALPKRPVKRRIGSFTSMSPGGHLIGVVNQFGEIDLPPLVEPQQTICASAKRFDQIQRGSLKVIRSRRPLPVTTGVPLTQRRVPLEPERKRELVRPYPSAAKAAPSVPSSGSSSPPSNMVMTTGAALVVGVEQSTAYGGAPSELIKLEPEVVFMTPARQTEIVQTTPAASTQCVLPLPQKSAQGTSSVGKLSEELTNPGNVYHVCQLCAFWNPTRSLLDEHICRVHLQQLPFQCIACNATFMKLADASKHVYKHCMTLYAGALDRFIVNDFDLIERHLQRYRKTLNYEQWKVHMSSCRRVAVAKPLGVSKLRGRSRLPAEHSYETNERRLNRAAMRRFEFGRSELLNYRRVNLERPDDVLLHFLYLVAWCTHHLKSASMQNLVWAMQRDCNQRSREELPVLEGVLKTTCEDAVALDCVTKWSNGQVVLTAGLAWLAAEMQTNTNTPQLLIVLNTFLRKKWLLLCNEIHTRPNAQSADAVKSTK